MMLYDKANLESTFMSHIPNNLKYAKTHEWAKPVGDHLIQVGISDFAQEELGDLVFVELPEVGRKVSSGEQCAVVESVKTASDLYSPVNGVVTQVNTALADDPSLLNQDAYTHWIFTLEVEDASLAHLLDAASYQAQIET